MGLAASQARLLMLTGRKSDLEFQAQKHCQRRMIISQQIGLLQSGDGQSISCANQYQTQYCKEQKEVKKTITEMVKSTKGFLRKLFTKLIPVLRVITTVMEIIKAINKPIKSSGQHQAQPNNEAEIKKLQEEDKRLEMKLKQVDTQQNAVRTEQEGVQKVIDKNIETSFKIFNR